MVDTIVIGGLLFARLILSSVRMLVANAVGGIITLIVASWFGFGVSISAVTLAVTAIAGIPGALLIVLLAHGGMAFVPPRTSEAGGILAEQAAENLQGLLGTFREFAGFVEKANSTVTDMTDHIQIGMP
jgi:hypothetical protein